MTQPVNTPRSRRMPIGQDLDVLLMLSIINHDDDTFDGDTEDYVLDDDSRWLGLLKIEVPRSPGIEKLPSLNIHWSENI